MKFRLKPLCSTVLTLHNSSCSISLFEGTKGSIGTVEISNDPRYSFVIRAVLQIRQRIFEEALLPRPFLELLAALYKDNAVLPNDPKHDDDPTPSRDSNQVTIQQKLLEDDCGPPTDEDVGYFKIFFLSIYLVPGVTSDNATRAQDAEDEGVIHIAHALIQLWEQTVE